MGTDLLYGVGAQDLAALAGVHISTARRWKRTGKYPRKLAPLLAVLRDGQLGPISRAWRGWCIRGDRLISPEGWSFTFGEIRSIPFMQAQVSGYQSRERTHLQADWIAERYVEAVAPESEAA
jgi:hypothetical protein